MAFSLFDFIFSVEGLFLLLLVQIFFPIQRTFLWIFYFDLCLYYFDRCVIFFLSFQSWLTKFCDSKIFLIYCTWQKSRVWYQFFIKWDLCWHSLFLNDLFFLFARFDYIILSKLSSGLSFESDWKFVNSCKVSGVSFHSFSTDTETFSSLSLSTFATVEFVFTIFYINRSSQSVEVVNGTRVIGASPR